MDRRTFIGGVAGGLLAWPLAAAAQQPGKLAVVGVLYSSTGPEPILDNARQALRDLGYVDGKKVRASGPARGDEAGNLAKPN